jgi:hypothetical protein
MKTTRYAALALSVGLTMGSWCAAAAGQAAPAKPQRVRVQMEGFELGPKTGKAPNQIGGASRGIGGLDLYAPKVGKAYSLTPTFLWSCEDASTEYNFKVSTPSMGTIYETKVTGGSFVYPADAPALVPGTTYTWQVGPSNDMLGGPKSASLLIVGGEDRAAIAAALQGGAGDAKVFVDKRVWYDALAAYTRLIQSEPDRAEYLKGRAALYDQLPQTQALADADVKKAQR